MVARSLRDTARDAWDILRWSRSTKEIVRAIAPTQWLSPTVLNDGPLEAPMHDTARFSETLQTLRNQLKIEFIDSGSVAYSKLAQSPLFAELELTSRQLRHMAPHDLKDDNARIAFWINVYNVLAIHGIIALGLQKSVMEVPSFFKTVSYRVGEWAASLDQIENGILRRNGLHPATRTQTLAVDHPLLAFAPGHVDPRIHMALVCAARSCPPVAFYTSEGVDHQLTLASMNYVGATVRVHEKHIEMPIIFLYYQEDFGGLRGIESFVLDHTDGEHLQNLRIAFKRRLSWKWSRYDWSLNTRA